MLGKRLERFGLTLHPDKTRLICFERPARAQQQGKGPDSFDFLGFTVRWRRSFKGQWVPTSHGVSFGGYQANHGGAELVASATPAERQRAASDATGRFMLLPW